MSKPTLSRATIENQTSKYGINKILVLFAVIAFLFLEDASAQTLRNTETSFDSASRGNLTVDPITQALQLQIPLESYEQRNGDLPIMLNYSSKVWQIKKSTRRSITCF